jgi:hypothetical protein
MAAYEALGSQYVAIAQKEPALTDSKLYKESLKPNLDRVTQDASAIQRFYKAKIEPVFQLSRVSRDLLMLSELQQAASH